MTRPLLRGVVLELSLAGLALAAQGAAVWLDVPFVRQVKNGCGAASVAMVMQYWLREGYYLPAEQAAPEKIHVAIYSPESRGTPAGRLEAYLRDHGFETHAFRGEWDDLRRHLEQGRPLIVCLKPNGEDSRHYLVVAGLDSERGLVLANDPARRKLTKFRRQNFEQEWKAADSWTLLAVPAQDR